MRMSIGCLEPLVNHEGASLLDKKQGLSVGCGFGTLLQKGPERTTAFSSPDGQHQGSGHLADSNTGSQRFMDSLSNLVNLIGSKCKVSTLLMLKKSAPTRGLDP